jgi:hypothetical protein
MYKNISTHRAAGVRHKAHARAKRPTLKAAPRFERIMDMAVIKNSFRRESRKAFPSIFIVPFAMGLVKERDGGIDKEGGKFYNLI